MYSLRGWTNSKRLTRLVKRQGVVLCRCSQPSPMASSIPVGRVQFVLKFHRKMIESVPEMRPDLANDDTEIEWRLVDTCWHDDGGNP